MSITAWAKELGVNFSTLHRRYLKGVWPDGKGRTRAYGNKSILYTFNGIELCLADWARKLGIKYATLYARISRGTPFETIADQIITGKPFRRKKAD
jgi:hypothetical protein